MRMRIPGPDAVRQVVGSKLWIMIAAIGLVAALGFKPQPIFAGWECLHDPGSACCFVCNTGDKPESCDLGAHCLFPNKSWFIMDT